MALFSALAATSVAPAHASYNPPYAGIVVDAKTGKVLYADQADAARHPASLTKVMTLYLLFDELKRGTMTLKTPLKISAEAARQPPSKVGLKTGGTIQVEAAIELLVTKSANDVAVTIAENIAGSETKFAERMTRKARAIGMKSTVFRNASGLPDPKQVTTARDLAQLGRAIQDIHPEYFDYFSVRRATHEGRAYGNHNKLLGSVKGVDGIKTGFIRASGFNLLTSVNHGGRSVVAVVLGGRTGARRDAHMRDLIDRYFTKATKGRRTAPLIAEAPMPPAPPPALGGTVALAANVPLPAPRPHDAENSTDEPDLPEPVMAAIAQSAPQTDEGDAADTPSPGDLTRTPDPIAQRIETANRLATETTTPVQDLRWIVGAQPATVSAFAGTTPGTTPGSPPHAAAPAQQAIASVLPSPAATQFAEPVTASLANVPSEPVAPPAQTARASTPAAPAPEPVETARVETPEAAAPEPQKSVPPGWQIQIAATPDKDQARDLLDRVSRTVKAVDGGVEPFTEPVEKDGVTLYRARFAGFSKHTAAAACKAVKKSSLSCFTLKN